MTLETAYSTATDPEDVARELARELSALEPRLLLFFASPDRDPRALARAISDAFPSARTIGCTTAGELAGGRLRKGCVAAMALPSTIVEAVAVAVIRDVHSRDAIVGALHELEQAFDAPMHALDPRDHLGLVLHDGLAMGEEKVMETVSDRTNVPFVGGSAGDDMRFRRTHVFVDGDAVSLGAVLALVRCRVPFSILKTQSFDVLDVSLRATDVDEVSRTVRRFDGRPAAEAYAAALGVPVAELPNHFLRHPLGLVTGAGEPFVRSPRSLNGPSVTFYCRIRAGAELRLLRGRDIVEDTRRDLAAASAKLGAVSGIVNFHCLLRTIELTERNQLEAYGDLFRTVRAIGFSTYGESYIGHMNQTSTMVLFGR